MKKFLLVTLSIILLISLSLTLYTAESMAKDGGTEKQNPAIKVYDPDKDIIVKVNDYEITFTMQQVAINNLMPTMAYHKSISERKRKTIEAKALNDLIVDQLLYEIALSRDLKIEKRDIKKAIRKFQNNLPKGMTLRKVLKQSDMSRDDLSNVFERMMLIRKVRTTEDERLMAKAKEIVNEEYMKKHYNDNLKNFKEPDKIHLSEILLKADPGGGKKIWLEVRAKAKKIRERIDAGADFAEVAKELSEDPYASKGGDMGWAHSGTLMEGFEEATTSLKTGEITGPIETLYGYHIIKLHGRKSSKLKPFEELNLTKLKKDLTKSEFIGGQKKLIKELKNKAKIVYFDAE